MSTTQLLIMPRIWTITRMMIGRAEEGTLFVLLLRRSLESPDQLTWVPPSSRSAVSLCPQIFIHCLISFAPCFSHNVEVIKCSSSYPCAENQHSSRISICCRELTYP
ncbi:hypothetical protein KP509_09G009600 [Ceratopteris richardii]|uniref:Uncharacterized protein n=1 Tax=Ceratopteris richardii TaxID=49495 RepID=A0A8T2U064_CERRI|nr:hypothetical protein KP509_09G009600 [Ceratopteris richardii]